MRTRSTYPPSPEFERVVRGEDRPRLDRVAFEIARDAYPDLDIDAYLARINEIADRVRVRCRPGAPQRALLDQINWALFVEEGYRGNTEDYFDPRNSYLNEVMDRKTGIPITLSILYWAIAERLDLNLSAACLPSHFMLRAEEDQGPVFIDPFHGGKFRDRNGCEWFLSGLLGEAVQLDDSQAGPCSAREVVARMLRNLKAIYQTVEDYPAALEVQRRLAAVSDDPRELLDLGRLCWRLERQGEAIDPLRAYLAASPQGENDRGARKLLEMAERLVASWN